jgi:hypothetical protein
MSTAAAAEAMFRLVHSQKPGQAFREAVLLDAHRALLEQDPLERRYAGKYRDVQNWIGGSDFSPRDAAHVPPPPAMSPMRSPTSTNALATGPRLRGVGGGDAARSSESC